MVEKEIVGKLKDYMQRNNLRQWEFAQKIGMPQRTLSRWLHKESKISRAYLRILEKEGII